MSRVPRWGYGSKRRIQLIRWSPYQIAGLVVLAFSLMALGFVLARLLASWSTQESEAQDSVLRRANRLYSVDCRLIREASTQVREL